MRTLIGLLLLLFTTKVKGQKETSTVALNNDVKLVSVIEKFDASEHRIDTCAYEVTFKYICRIDGQKWYGSDQGFELLLAQLKRLTVIINGQSVPLKISGMFNPGFGYELNPN